MPVFQVKPREDFVKKIGWVETIGDDGVITSIQGAVRHSEAVLERKLNLKQIVMQTNPNVQSLKSMTLTGIYIEGFFKVDGVATGYSCWNKVIIQSPTFKVTLDPVKGSSDWKPNRVTVNFPIPVVNPVVTVRREIGCDAGYWTGVGGYVGNGSRNLVLTFTYDYIGIPPAPKVLHVKVLDEYGKPLKNAVVYLENSNGNILSQAYTNDTGVVTFIKPEGDYVLEVYANGYNTVKTVVHIPSNVTVRMNPRSQYSQVLTDVGKYVKPIVIGGALVFIGLAGYKLYKEFTPVNLVKKVLR